MDEEQEKPRQDGPPAPEAGAPGEIPVRSGEAFDGGTDEDEDAGAGFGEGDDARRHREQLQNPD